MASRADQRLVNICLHGIGRPARPMEPGEDAYWIDPSLFEQVLDVAASDPRVRISFDDGNASDLALGLPALRERGMTATFFVLAGRLDRPGSLSSADVRELVDAGMRIGTHGMDHVPWRGLSDASLRRELVDARIAIAEAAGTPVLDAALPLGRYDRRVLDALRREGYLSVHTSDRRWARDGAWLQPRFSVHSDDTPDSVRQRVLATPSVIERAKRGAIGLVKRYR
ncbi:polysaccharide deacetylase family protein [Nocardioides sp. CER19]|uniref:polysaccharide deacetylase family protein n=1 Tax=Nocardioides sp. CER19 TaxID=3038538 RepID=UPI00244CFC03|nr:polysaccharide deacetylase family protein [Nocardioides sp. CER19]MDH2414830.1 polysaccharide deacetylase family protein [Nocardioides sp. CER19]